MDKVSCSRTQHSGFCEVRPPPTQTHDFPKKASNCRIRQIIKVSLTYRAHHAISHCSHLLLTCRVVTNISHWLKVQSRWFENYIFAKKCTLISFWIFQYCSYYSFTLYYCAIFYSLDAGFFQYHRGVKQFGSRSGPTFCRA